jgi:nicotinamide-nucleotide amidase
MLTDVPGSSRYFQFGWVTYSEQAKTELLGVDPQLFIQHGVVSEPVAKAMAQGCRQKSGSDLAISITGIAGPDGGTAEKPVGTVFIALAHPNGTQASAFLFSGDRQTIRHRAAMMALTMLRFHLLGRPAAFLL